MLNIGNQVVIIKGAGDLATGIAYRLWRAHFKILMLEVEKPLVVRRTVSAAAAVFDQFARIEDLNVKLITDVDDFQNDFDGVRIIVDEKGACINLLSPLILVDAIMAKRNTGTTKKMAPIVIGVGPGFNAPIDVDAVVETKRGHYLGRSIYSGSAIPNTGIPGIIGGYGIERLLRSPAKGYVRPLHKIGDMVEKGQIIAFVGEDPVVSKIDGILRGLIHPSVLVVEGMKIGDIDPRCDIESCFTISDKALSVGGGVLEAIAYKNKTI